jgi:flagellar hook-basal body complex protein FliE
MSVFITSPGAAIPRELPMTRPGEVSGAGEIGAARTTRETSATPFAELLENAVGEANQSIQTAETATTAFARGEQHDLDGTLIALSQANIRLQLVGEIRNHLLDAYREVMRMNV